jgi:galactosyl transferase GMA12/MNN10 family
MVSFLTMKFAVCSLALGAEYKDTIKWCITSQEEHARRHGYTRITDESVFVPERDATWSKIPLLQKYLPNYDYIMWIDGDVLITNQDRTIEEFIELMDPAKFLFIGRDFQGLNAGVFVIRNCPLALEFLADAWNRPELARVLFHEQTAMTDLLATPKYKGCAQILPHAFINIMNAYDYRMDPKVHWLPGDFCIHFAGIKDPRTRLALQEAYLRVASNDPQGTERVQKYAALKKALDCKIQETSATTLAGAQT